MQPKKKKIEMRYQFRTYTLLKVYLKLHENGKLSLQGAMLWREERKEKGIFIIQHSELQSSIIVVYIEANYSNYSISINRL